MIERAEITSVDAIADFRTALLVYISKVRPLLDDSSDEVYRMREWIRTTQRVKWENKVQMLTRALADAQHALFSAELAKLRPPSSAELAAVRKARRDLSTAEETLRTVKRVSLNFDKEALPRVTQIEGLRGLVAVELSEAARFLERVTDTLDAYSEVRK